MPAVTDKIKMNLVTELNPNSLITEAYRTLRMKIQYSTSSELMKTVLLTSVTSKDEKSKTIANLAVIYAREGKKVLVIDADLRTPMLHHTFTSNGFGLADILLGQSPLSNAISETQIANLSFIPAGHATVSPSELLSSEQMQELLSQVKEEFDIVLIDSPPVLAVTDAQIMAAISDGVVLIVNQGKVKREAAKKALAQLNYVKAVVLGAVLVNTSK
jgi:capsular exopolysaccharide synthesis family protein